MSLYVFNLLSLYIKNTANPDRATIWFSQQHGLGLVPQENTM